MTKTKPKVYALTVVLFAVGIVLSAAPSASVAGDTILKEIVAYRQWTRVTEEPIQVSALSFAG